ncbi:MAG: hypothetical protein Q8P51_10200 [Ignavibacteria bacterium]|nr:hypothetical protein [Ignavibacteria bacterium]
MRNQRSMLFAAMLVFLSACSDYGTKPLVSPEIKDGGTIAFRIPKSEAPADVWVIAARLERQGYQTVRESVFVAGTPDTVLLTITGVPSGYWNVTVEARDSAGSTRYTGSSSVLIIEGETVQAYVQMNSTGGKGKVEIIVTWPSSQPQLLLRTSGNFFLAQELILVTITNAYTGTLILASCCARPDIRVQRKLDGGWSPPGACELMCPSILLPLKPGTTISDSVLRIAQPGLYRLMLRYSDPRRASAVLFAAYSNEFWVLSTQSDSAKLNEMFGLKFGQRVVLQGTDLTLTFKDVTEDSRCPEGVVCVWQGNARILLGVNQTAMALNTTLEPKQALYSAYVIQFLSLQPYPKLGQQIKKEEYVAALVVTGRR